MAEGNDRQFTIMHTIFMQHVPPPVIPLDLVAQFLPIHLAPDASDPHQEN